MKKIEIITIIIWGGGGEIPGTPPLSMKPCALIVNCSYTI